MKKYCSHGHSPPSRCPQHRKARKARNKAKAVAGWETRRKHLAETAAAPEGTDSGEERPGTAQARQGSVTGTRGGEEVIALTAPVRLG